MPETNCVYLMVVNFFIRIEEKYLTLSGLKVSGGIAKWHRHDGTNFVMTRRESILV